MNCPRLVGLVLCALPAGPGWAEEGLVAVDPEIEPAGWSLQVRPHVGVGVTTVGSYQRGDGVPWGVAGIAGLRGLTGPTPWFAFGAEVSWLSTGLDAGEGPRDMTLIGPVAELRFMQVGHLNVGGLWAKEHSAERRSYLDIVTSIGFEPWANHRWSPLLVYRSDTIFTSSPTSVRTIAAGLRYTF